MRQLIFLCLCLLLFGEGDCDVQLDKDTNSGEEGERENYWHLLEVADLRFDIFIYINI